MLSPHGRMSEFQRAQMYSLQDANIHNLALTGVFDECQDIVTALAGDLEFKSRFRLGAVTSNNCSRIAAQTVYSLHKCPGGEECVISGSTRGMQVQYITKK